MSNNALPLLRQTSPLWPVTCATAQALVQGRVIPALCLSSRPHRVCAGRWGAGRGSRAPGEAGEATQLSTVIIRVDSKCKLGSENCVGTWGSIGSSNPPIDFWSLYLSAWNKAKKGVQSTRGCDAASSRVGKTPRRSQILQSCWWAMHLVSALETKEAISRELWFLSSGKFPEEGFAGSLMPLWVICTHVVCRSHVPSACRQDPGMSLCLSPDSSQGHVYWADKSLYNDI